MCPILFVSLPLCISVRCVITRHAMMHDAAVYQRENDT